MDGSRIEDVRCVVYYTVNKFIPVAKEGDCRRIETLFINFYPVYRPHMTKGMCRKVNSYVHRYVASYWVADRSWCK